MKKILLSLVVVICCFSFFTATAQTSVSKVNYAKQNQQSPLAGAWQSADGKAFAMMSDGFFSSMGQDSTGRRTETHAGTYTVDNANTLTFKVLYSSFPEHIGSLHTVEYELKGDNLTIKWFKKLVDARQVDITAQMPKGQQSQYIRAKK